MTELSLVPESIDFAKVFDKKNERKTVESSYFSFSTLPVNTVNQIIVLTHGTRTVTDERTGEIKPCIEFVDKEGVVKYTAASLLVSTCKNLQLPCALEVTYLGKKTSPKNKSFTFDDFKIEQVLIK